jgi:hypothetical protein
VYVEGPRDRDVLRAWARRLSPGLAKRLAPACMILGGRQPARAIEDLRRRRAIRSDARGLCVLDGDDFASATALDQETGLELFVWKRRHIESYLLVPDAIGRALGVRDGRIRQLFRDVVPPVEDERAFASFDAKAFLTTHGPLAQLVGRNFPPGRIARTMWLEELHPEVQALLARISEGLGVIEPRVAMRTVTPARGPAGLS